MYQRALNPLLFLFGGHMTLTWGARRSWERGGDEGLGNIYAPGVSRRVTRWRDEWMQQDGSRVKAAPLQDLKVKCNRRLTLCSLATETNECKLCGSNKRSTEPVGLLCYPMVLNRGKL